MPSITPVYKKETCSAQALSLSFCQYVFISPENLFSQTDKEREEARNQIIALVKKYI